MASTFLRSQIEVVFSSIVIFSLQKCSCDEIQWFPDVLESVFKSRAMPSFYCAMFKKFVVLVGNLNEKEGFENCSHESYLGYKILIFGDFCSNLCITNFWSICTAFEKTYTKLGHPFYLIYLFFATNDLIFEGLLFAQSDEEVE